MNLTVMLLMGVLAIIALVTIAVLFRAFSASSTKKPRSQKTPEPAKKSSGRSSASKQPSSRPAPRPEPKLEPKPEPEKSLAQKVLEEEEEDPVAEAEVFLTYGLNDKATELLEKHLAQNPSDEAAKALLEKAQET